MSDNLLNRHSPTQDVLAKLYRFCAYQERCSYDVIRKLKSLEIPEKDWEAYLLHLKQEKYLDDKRFASAYMSGKLRQNKWGRQKLRKGLREKQLPADIVDQALSELNEDLYMEILKDLIHTKHKRTKAKSTYELKQKILHFVYGKGFEIELAKPIIENLIN